MPHSSGGGSHGGGSHGGSHGGSGGPRISTHYFAGARHYRKHHVSTGEDEYIYASSMPKRTGLSSIIFIIVFAVFFLGFGFAGVISDRPNKLKIDYWDNAAIHDDLDFLKYKDSLLATMEEFQEITGICPVIYTTFNEAWQDDYADLESYAYDVYVNNFEDESHFVIVYSIKEDDRILLKNEKTGVPDYAWEAIQGNDTDNILTETTFKHFADKIQKELEDGENPGRAFDDAFKYLNKRFVNQLKPGSFTRIVSIMMSCIPLFIVAGFFALFLILSIKNYNKDKDVVYEEVPLKIDPNDPAIASGTAVTGNYHSKEFHYVVSKGGPVPKAAKVITYAVTIPFIAIGFCLIAAGIGIMRSSDATGGGFLLIFGVIWTIISFFTLVKMTASFIKAKKQTEDHVPLTAEYPDMNTVNNFTQNTVTSAPDQTEFDPRFFNNPRSSIEDDDEDYKRMKRKGFE